MADSSDQTASAKGKKGFLHTVGHVGKSAGKALKKSMPKVTLTNEVTGSPGRDQVGRHATAEPLTASPSQLPASSQAPPADLPTRAANKLSSTLKRIKYHYNLRGWGGTAKVTVKALVVGSMARLAWVWGGALTERVGCGKGSWVMRPLVARRDVTVL